MHFWPHNEIPNESHSTELAHDNISPSTRYIPHANNISAHPLAYFQFLEEFLCLRYWALCTSLQMLPLTSGTRIFIITNIHNEIKWTHDLVLTAQAHHPSWLSNRWLLKLPRSAGPDISLRIMEILFTNIAFDTTCLSIHKTLTVSLKNQ